MKLSLTKAALVVLCLGAVHLGLAAMPGATLSPAWSFVLFATNLYVVYAALLVKVERRPAGLAMFAVGYLVLFLLLMVLLDKKPLFILLIILYASVFRSPFLLGCFAIFVLSFVVLQPYALETFVPLVLIYLVVWRVRDASRFARLCLTLGLVMFAAVLLPLFHLGIQDSLQTLGHTLARPDVQEAVWLSVASSTVATLFVALWGIPLAYALSRLEFPGKRLVESLIDVPILVPQSVAGIALLVLLGPASPLGAALNDAFGVQIAGRFVGIVLAQVFVASPFLIKTALTAFAAVPETLEMASRTLGASPAVTFWRITLPLASRGVAVGGILAWSRAISEFGAVVLFASAPLTAPVLVHTEFLRAGAAESRPIATLLLIICLWIFIVLQLGQTLLPTALQGAARGRPR
ncbi:MAG: ABC transporter permease [Deltaproteobacteria bacterium]|nr:ABC transporter permease [Deltaproteobacteria bacterium]